jgi:2-polyprenyl-3-methyl-5-hydroxy-6-metoxy-1,4-benzoquinol methylase
MTTINHKGWFKIAGVQDGDRTLEQQLKGLETISEAFAGAHVLDLGCAEGLIGRHCVDAWKASSVDGITTIQYEIDEALRQCAGRPMRFYKADLRHRGEYAALELRPRYGVVLMLSILHKLRKPLDCLAWALERCGGIAVIRLPAPVIVDARSNFQPADVRAFMNERADLVAEPRTCVEPISGRPEWMGVWRVRA